MTVNARSRIQIRILFGLIILLLKRLRVVFSILSAIPSPKINFRGHKNATFLPQLFFRFVPSLVQTWICRRALVGAKGVLTAFSMS